MYSEGKYFQDPTRHSEDSEYKVKAIKRILIKYLANNNIEIKSYADVGCGSGTIVKLLARELKQVFTSLKVIKGFDVSPHVADIDDAIVDFYFEDFTKTNESFDLVTLNDVFEHVPDPVTFLKEVGKRSKHVVMHIPLEDSLSVNLRNLQNKKIKNPGHLVFLNINSAINLITFSGLKVVDYEYSKEALKAPSNNKTILQKVTYPFKALLLNLNPYLFSKLFGISIVVIAKGIDLNE